jgi:deoxyribodipyrimidine photo-lyase
VSLDTGLVWFRRDLRITDHAALARSLSECRRVWCVFLYDRAILDALHADGVSVDRRVDFIQGSIAELDCALRRRGGGLITRHDFADAIPRLARDLAADAVYANHDIEPDAMARDAAVAESLAREGRQWVSCKDQTVFEKAEVLTRTGSPFAVFTPYKAAWLKRLQPADVAPHEPTGQVAHLMAPPATDALISLADLGFAPSNLKDLPITPGESGAGAALEDFEKRIDAYAATRDFPALRGPSYLSVHLRFGTISVRALARTALARPRSVGARSWLSELIWREFYQMILWHHPHVVRGAWRSEYDRITWEAGPQADEHFAAWCEGRTGYPLVDAAMAQLNQTGYMHNRLRMVSASFLVKDLGIDWRRGERYFARHLSDFDLASNNGGWQWAASTGCDAQPYFRIFNPVRQSERFDLEGRFIRRYQPQLAGFADKQIHAPWTASGDQQVAAGCVVGRDTPTPLIDHAQARLRTLARYRAART